MHADVNNPSFKFCEKWTERGLLAGTLFTPAKSAFSLIKQEMNLNRSLGFSKSFWNQPIRSYETGAFSTNRAYSGIDVERIVKNIKNTTLRNKIVNPCILENKFYQQLQRQYGNHGQKSIIKSYKSLIKLREEHTNKLQTLKYASSATSKKVLVNECFFRLP